MPCGHRAIPMRQPQARPQGPPSGTGGHHHSLRERTAEANRNPQGCILAHRYRALPHQHHADPSIRMGDANPSFHRGRYPVTSRNHTPQHAPVNLCMGAVCSPPAHRMQCVLAVRTAPRTQTPHAPHAPVNLCMGAVCSPTGLLTASSWWSSYTTSRGPPGSDASGTEAMARASSDANLANNSSNNGNSRAIVRRER